MASITELGNKYSNVIDKLRNPKVDNEVAWETAQPLLSHLIEGYPEAFKPYLPTVKSVFDLRRDAFRKIDDRQANSQKAKELIKNVNNEDLDPLFVGIRDIFNISAPGNRNVQQSRDDY